MAITTKSQHFCSILNLLAILQFLFFFPSESLTVDLIPRDSPLSPFYNPSITHIDRLHNAFQRSLKRVNYLKQSKIQASLNPGGGEYLMKISIGTPPIEAIGIVDTGSDLTWTQCLPCKQCYNQTIPLFDPTKSSSYHTIPCQSYFCNILKDSQCDHNDTCGYSYLYEDGSHTKGNLLTETLRLGTKNPITRPFTVIGCAHDTAGIFDASASGIIGLGNGNLSLISQFATDYIDKKFSFCLVPTTINSTSKLNFGNDAIVSGPGVVTTPLVTKPNSSLYFLTLEGLSVGNKRIAFAYNIGDTKTNPKINPNVVEGNIIIDSGTEFTLLPSDIYNGLQSALDIVIKAKKVSDPHGFFGHCYQGTRSNIKLPNITAHFKGANVNLQPVNTYSWVKKDVVCFTIISSNTAIFGNLAQTNFLVGYDLDDRTVSFKPTDCSKQP